jgi:hypothetical protein
MGHPRVVLRKLSITRTNLIAREEEMIPAEADRRTR